MNRFYIFLTISILVLAGTFFAFKPASAEALVPCGHYSGYDSTGNPIPLPGYSAQEAKPCQPCDLLVLGSRVINFMLFTLVPALAVLLYLIAGFMILLGGANPSMVSNGRSIFKTTTYGLIIIFMSWMITNTVLKIIAGDSQFTQDWYRVTCTSGPNGGVIGTNIKYACNASNQCVVTTGGQYSESTCAGNCAPAAGAACMFSGVNLCQGQSATCSNGSCAQYNTSINRYAGGAATANVLKAFIFAESSCNASVTSFNGSSFGIMQMQPSTANMFKNRCIGVFPNGVLPNITASWLTNPANADASICIGAAYINSIAAGRCGSEVRNIYAGYNGGPGACADSVDCAGETSCDGSQVRKWECLYDNSQHTVCNGGNDLGSGYNQTRAAAVKIIYCESNPGF